MDDVDAKMMMLQGFWRGKLIDIIKESIRGDNGIYHKDVAWVSSKFSLQPILGSWENRDFQGNFGNAGNGSGMAWK